MSENPITTLSKEVDVPSNGWFGGPKKVTLRAMMVSEEKILYTAKDFNFIKKLVKACCIEPKDLDIKTLHPNDLIYLLYAIRLITFGSKFTDERKCPECGLKQTIEIDISDMEMTQLETEGLEEKLKVKLPVMGDELQLKLLSQGEIDDIDRKISAGANKGTIRNAGEYEFISRLKKSIDLKNGEQFESEAHKLAFIEKLNARDLAAIQATLGKIEFGFDTTVYRECCSCGAEMEVTGTICPEFFHPTTEI